MSMKAGDYTYDPDTLRIIDPGKFEGEPRWLPYFYEAWGAGEAATEDAIEHDGAIECQAWIYIADYDLIQFPELRGYYQVRIMVDEQGFVYGEAILEPPAPTT